MNCSLPGVVSRADCQGTTFHLPDMSETGGWVCDEMGGGIACVSGPRGTPLPEVGRAYVSYLRKSFGVAGTMMDKGRRMEYTDRLKNKNVKY